MMTSLVRMRLHGFWRSGRIAAPTITAIVVIGALYGGGAEQAGEAYGLSSYILLPVLAWQTKLLLDTEPDVARQLAGITVGRRQELVAGLLAAAIAGLMTVAIALTMPWLIGGIELPVEGSHDPSIVAGLALGIWAHLLVIPIALVLGAMASRPIARSVGLGAMALIGGWLCVVVAGLPRSPVQWLAPPLIDTAKAARSHVDTPLVIGLTGWTLAWVIAAGAVYVGLRRNRA
jgi:hypothetical protein